MLGLSQIRYGPNKIRISGILQPVLDGVKLLLKETFFLKIAQRSLFLIGPLLLIFIFLSVWGAILSWGNSGLVLAHFSALLFFIILGLGPYAIVFVGWARTSPFSKLGSLRGMLQRLSFEVAIVLVLFLPLFFFKTLVLRNENRLGLEIRVWAVFWLFLVLVESNRAPFDLLEGERELISGFNIEMGRISFVFIFLSEYGILIALRLLATIGISGTLNYLSVLGVVLTLYVRRCYPRVRYDTLMGVIWHRILPISLIGAIFFLFLKLETSVLAITDFQSVGKLLSLRNT